MRAHFKKGVEGNDVRTYIILIYDGLARRSIDTHTNRTIQNLNQIRSLEKVMERLLLFLQAILIMGSNNKLYKLQDVFWYISGVEGIILRAPSRIFIHAKQKYVEIF